MKIPRWFVILPFVVAILLLQGLSSSTALADSLPPDPGVRLCCGGGSGALTGPNPTFDYTVTGEGLPGTNGDNEVDPAATQDFVDNTGADITKLTLDMTAFNPGGTAPNFTFICEDATDPYFTSCVVTHVSATENIVTFSDGFIPFFTPSDNFPTVGSCSNEEGCFADFAIEILDVNGDLAQLPTTEGFTVHGTATTTPEPPTVLLLLAGLVSFVLLGRTRLIRYPTFKL